MTWDKQHIIIAVSFFAAFGSVAASQLVSRPITPLTVASLLIVAASSVAAFFKNPPQSVSDAISQGEANGVLAHGKVKCDEDVPPAPPSNKSV